MDNEMTLQEAYERLEFDVGLAGKLSLLVSGLAALPRIAVAFSGGVDSTLLLEVARKARGGDVVALTAKSPSLPARELAYTRRFCVEHNVRQVIAETREFAIPGFDRNPPDRCYLCKRSMLETLAQAAKEAGAEVLAEGSNADDDDDFRPGFRAVCELGVSSPLREAGLCKDEVRTLARVLGLEVWDKPAFACLNTRFEQGSSLTLERLAMVEQAEDFMHDLGIAQVRVRVLGDDAPTAIIEVLPEHIGALALGEVRERLALRFRDLGFGRVALDLEGYRRGSMNG